MRISDAHRRAGTFARALVSGAALALVVASLACATPTVSVYVADTTDSDDPPFDGSAMPIRIINESCVADQCDSLRILAFPLNQPGTPGGPWSLDLGVVATAEACVTLPPSATFLVIGVGNNGTPPDTVTFKWNLTAPIAFGTQAPSDFRTFARPSTVTFVPNTARGWTYHVPSGQQLSPDAPCAP